MNKTARLPQLLSMMCDTLSVMLKQETAYSVSDYLHEDPRDCVLIRGETSPGENDSDEDSTVTVRHPNGRITPEDRAKLVDWCYSIVDGRQLQRESVAVAMNIVDRFMSVSPAVHVYLYDRDEYQLLTVASLYLATKVLEQAPFSSEAVSAISRGVYSAGEIEAVELEILAALGWRLCPPTPAAVGRQILEILELAIPASAVGSSTYGFLREELAYQTELAVLDYRLSTICPGTVAVAALLNAAERVSDVSDQKSLTGGFLCVQMEFSRQLSSEGPQGLVETGKRLEALVEENDKDDAVETAPHGGTAFATPVI